MERTSKQAFKIRNETGLSTTVILSNNVVEVLARAMLQKEGKKRMKIGKEVKLCLFLDVIIHNTCQTFHQKTTRNNFIQILQRGRVQNKHT